jgi:putative glutamine amidotransferase
MSRKPKIGVTWGSHASPEHMRKLLYYIAQVRAAGGDPVAVLPLQAVGDAIAYISREDCGLYQLHAGEGAAARDFDGILFAGGDDIEPFRYREEPETETLQVDAPRDGVELPLLRGALEAGVPVFGICRGAQLLNIALGGTLIQDIPSQHADAIPHGKGAEHEIRIVPGSRLASLAGSLKLSTNSYHHQGMTDPTQLAPGLVATATSSDGIIEALEPVPGTLSGYVMAVQWHPERSGPEEGGAYDRLTRALFADFLDAARQRAQGSAVLYF